MTAPPHTNACPERAQGPAADAPDDAPPATTRDTSSRPVARVMDDDSLAPWMERRIGGGLSFLWSAPVSTECP